MDSNEAVKVARRHHRAGKLADAEKIYRDILRYEPQNAEAMHLLGALLGGRGDIEQAIELIRQSLSMNPADAEAHRNLGVLLATRGLAAEAFTSFSHAVKLQPDEPQFHLDLAKILTVQNRWQEAAVEFGAVARITPNSAEIHYQIGQCLAKIGKLDEAIAAYSASLRLKPKHAMAHFNIAHAYRAMGRLENALPEYAQAIHLHPELLEAHASMAAIFSEQNRFDEAMASYQRAARINPDAAVTLEALGWIKLRKGEGAAAAEEFRRAIAADPNLLSAWNALGLALQYQGEFEEAASCFRRMLVIRPGFAIAHKHLVNTTRQSGQAEIDSLRQLLDRPNLSIEDRIPAEFALGTALDDAERFDEAFAHFAAANDLARKRWASIGDRYDADEFHQRVDRLIQHFTPEFFQQRRDWGDPSSLPVFVVGMPRSGTTLVQQIAASHSQVYGAGELKAISQLTSRFDETNPRAWDRAEITLAAQKHVDDLRQMSETAARIIDKMPSNLHRLGLISVLFPNARIVLCRRDPRDTCLSCYFQSFAPGNIFSYNLADCGHYHRENDRLADHWLKVLPMAILELRYEDVVTDLEGQSRRLIEFLGLAWEPACLEFYRSKTTVSTSSVWQVRQPLYQRSVGRWRHYERHLGPLLKALDD